MGGDSSAYAALGLEPGANWQAIERAYKKLIKEHHPDREGGDAKRAAEITKAYRELRSSGRFNDPLEFHEDFSARPRRRKGWALAAVLTAVILGASVLVAGPTSSVDRHLSPGAPRLDLVHATKRANHSDPMDAPLHLKVIEAAVRDAMRISRHSDEMALASESRTCHHQLRSEPTLTQLDRCVAFDDAVVELQDRDPLRDQGQFGELSVTGRQWSGANTLSNDYVAIDGRLDRIRLRVAIALAPIVEAQETAGN